MSEDMSDRMPEDLPVRKCINVMVGITRSKVICICHSFYLISCRMDGYVQTGGPDMYKPVELDILLYGTLIP